MEPILGDHGLLLLGTGIRPTVGLLPALTITADDLACFRERFEQWLDALSEPSHQRSAPLNLARIVQVLDLVPG